MKPTAKTHAANAANDTLPVIDIPTGDDPAPAEPQPGEPLSPMAIRLDPTDIYVGPGPNRDEASFQSDEFFALSDSIFACRGNLQPIAVIPLAPTNAPPGTRYKYQQISGERNA